MQARNAHSYILTGAYHWFLQTVSAGAVVHSVPGTQDGVLTSLDSYLANLALFDLEVTSQMVWELNGIRDELATLPEGATLTPEHASRIKNIVSRAERTLWVESAKKTVFVVTDKRVDTRKLLYAMGELLRKGAYRGLPMMAVRDLEEAGKCIAFERPTAAAFHLLRGTEAVLRHYYSCVVKRNRLQKPWGWKAMTDQMAARRQPPSKALLDNLDALRQNFRNPTAHPEKTYDIDEAQDLLNACLDVINRMTREPQWAEPTDSFNNLLAELRKRRDAGAPTPTT